MQNKRTYGRRAPEAAAVEEAGEGEAKASKHARDEEVPRVLAHRATVVAHDGAERAVHEAAFGEHPYRGHRALDDLVRLRGRLDALKDLSAERLAFGDARLQVRRIVGHWQRA